MSLKFLLQSVLLVVTICAVCSSANTGSMQAETGSRQAILASGYGQNTHTSHRYARGDTLWDNTFQNSTNGMWYNVRYTGMPAGRQTCNFADDFYIPEEEIWTIEDVTVAMYWYGRAPDSFYGRIYRNDIWSPEETPLYEFNFTAGMPQSLRIYYVPADVRPSNITLTGGSYWLSVVSVYTNQALPAVDTPATAWLRDENHLGDFGASCQDSLGLFYGEDNVPTPWWLIWFNTNTESHSVWFLLRGTKTVSAITHDIAKNTKSVKCHTVNAHAVVFNTENTDAKTIAVFDLYGKQVATVSVDNTSTNVATRSLANGMYVYRITNVAGKTIRNGTFALAR